MEDIIIPKEEYMPLNFTLQANLHHEKGLIPFKLKGIEFSFELQSLCRIFDTDLKNQDEKIFITKTDLFASPLAKNADFNDWYFKYADAILLHVLVEHKRNGRKKFIQDVLNSIRETKKSMKETLKNSKAELEYKTICEKKNPIVQPLTTIRRIHFLFDTKYVKAFIHPENYVFFELSSLCEAFDVEKETLEAEIDFTCPCGNMFINELKIFVTCMAENSEFLNWYEHYVIPTSLSFMVNSRYGNERYIETLIEELARLEIYKHNIKKCLK